MACQFGHIARLGQRTPAHTALHCQVGLASGRSLGGDWRRRPGRPRARWTDQLRNDTGSVPDNLWRQAILRGAMVERRDSQSWLRDDDDDDMICSLATRMVQAVTQNAIFTTKVLAVSPSMVVPSMYLQRWDTWCLYLSTFLEYLHLYCTYTWDQHTCSHGSFFTIQYPTKSDSLQMMISNF